MSVYNTTDLAKALPAVEAQRGVDPSATPFMEGFAAAEGGLGTTDGATIETKRDPQAYGWAQKQSYDYGQYNKTNKENAEEAAAKGDVSTNGWASNAAKYEWSDDFGDVGPAFPELEKQLFNTEYRTRAGNSLEYIKEIEVYQEGVTKINPCRSFKDAGLHPVMLQNVELCGYVDPTPVQAFCMPAILKGHDIVACAQTGSGKTAAFLIPTLSKLMGKAKMIAAPRPNPVLFREGIDMVRAEPLLLVVCPSRELATQIFDEARRFCYRSMLRPCVLYGGGPVADQIYQLRKGCDVLIATPGRLCDIIDRPHVLSLKRLKYTIIDEADEMLDSSWATDFKKIMTGGDQEQGNITYMMFSATFPKSARDLAKEHLAVDHVRIRIGRAGSSHRNIQQRVYWTDHAMKRQALIDLLYASPPARTIIFVNSKRTADEVDDFLFNNGMPSTSIHADRTQREREDAMRAFRKGKAPILVATGLSARGLDTRSVMHVINFELPNRQYGGISEYIHRIGRTGRIGNLGIATSFYNDRDAELAEELTKTLMETNQEIPNFLEQYKPQLGEGERLRFEADSDFGDLADGDLAAIADGGLEVSPSDIDDSAISGAHGWDADDEAEVSALGASAAAPAKNSAKVPNKKSLGVERDPAVVQKAKGWNNLAKGGATFAEEWAEHAEGSAPKAPTREAPVPNETSGSPGASATTTNWDNSW